MPRVALESRQGCPSRDRRIVSRRPPIRRPDPPTSPHASVVKLAVSAGWRLRMGNRVKFSYRDRSASRHWSELIFPSWWPSFWRSFWGLVCTTAITHRIAKAIPFDPQENQFPLRMAPSLNALILLDTASIRGFHQLLNDRGGFSCCLPGSRKETGRKKRKFWLNFEMPINSTSLPGQPQSSKSSLNTGCDGSRTPSMTSTIRRS